MTSEEKIHIQQETKDQAGSNTWVMECRKRLRASVAGGIVKMIITMKGRRLRIYCTVNLNTATYYGQVLKERAKEEYQTYQNQHDLD